MTKIGIGTKFSASYADGMALWKVTEKRGPKAWEAEITKESLDYVGTKRVFGEEEIASCLNREKVWNNIYTDHNKFFASLNFGDIVHYHNAFGQYVRCEVVRATVDRHGKPVEHGRALRAIALVGAWREYDLPRRRDDGSVDLQHYPKMVLEGETFEPNFSNIYEAPDFYDRGRGDPRPMKALDLSVPDMTPSEEEAAELVRIVQQVGKLVGWNNDVPGSQQTTPQQKLEAVYMLVSSVKAKRFMRPEVRV